MRLELEPNPSQIVYSESASLEMSAEGRAEEAARHLREGIKAAQSGNRSSARASLLRAAEIDPRNESAWLWLSSISEYPEELLVFLTNVLEINPLNARALEWSAATRALLAKNFVQRGIDTAESGQQEMAAQHFNQALEYDERNSMAWLWLASLADSNEGKLTYLEKVLEFDPENEAARSGYDTAKNAIRTGLLAEARAAAVAGRAVEANALLEAIIAEEPNAEDAWVLRSHLANDFASKVAAFQRVLEINPDNAAAKAGLESLTLIMDAVTDAERSQPSPEAVTEQPADEVFEAAANSIDTSPSEEKQELADQDRYEQAAEFVDEQPTWAGLDFDSEAGKTESENIEVSPTPFDSFADDSLGYDDSSIQVETSDASQTFDFVSQPGPTSVENIFEGEFVPPAVEMQNEPVDSESQWEGISWNDNQARHESSFLAESTPEPDDTIEPEPIVYEMLPALDDEAFETEPPVEDVATPTEFTIPAPASNPFGDAPVEDEADRYKTVVSVELDDQMRSAVENYDPVAPAVEERPVAGSAFDVPFDMTMYGGHHIPMPSDDITEPVQQVTPSYETRIVNVPSEPAFDSTQNACPFCEHENDIQVITCNGCMAVLTLADLELVLANHNADKNVMRKAVERMESERSARELSESELTTLGIGHLNLRNLQLGYQYLHEASQKNPDNVVLSGQVNALLIRLEEIKQQDAAHEAMSKGKTILVVDDSPTVRKLIAGKLEKCGHEVFCSSDGVEAMEALETMKPDLILLDITMPRMDGYQVCKLIRGNESLKDVPVVMISGKDGFFDKVRGRMAGTSGYITKPFGPETLMKAVESYLRPEA